MSIIDERLKKREPQKGGWIDPGPLETDAEVKMRPGGAPRRAHSSYFLSLPDLVTCVHQEPIEVEIDGVQAKAVIEHNRVAAKELLLG